MEIYIILEGHDFYNEVQTMTQVFYPFGKYILANSISERSVTVRTELKEDKCTAFVYEDGLFLRLHEEPIVFAERAHLKNTVKVCVFHALAAHTEYMPKWGILTGIRPAKLASAMLAEGKDDVQILDVFKNSYLAAEEKAALALEVAKNARRLMTNRPPENAVNLYIGIPFCPSRCIYCSFTSEPYDEKRAWDYLSCLKKEIAALPDVALSSVYIGGGTPTSLNSEQLSCLLSLINEKFNVNGVEYTVEAGRPDTISREKLEILINNGASRISVNPQSMNSGTLELIGRKHSPQSIVSAFEMSRAAGFENINMDLILGLPNETPDDVENTFKRILELKPDSITVHTLSVKRASRLNEEFENHAFPIRADIEQMLEISDSYARRMGMFPYSMYRQKNMLGNFENVGWCVEGRHSIFNIETLEETRTILAVGAGAVTKKVCGDKISRVFNVKNVDEYMKRLDGATGFYI